MKTQNIVKELEEAARQLGLEIRKEKGNFRGGSCVVGGNPLIMLNKHHVPEVHLTVLAECLRDYPVETLYLKPAVRKALEETWDAMESMMVEDADVE